MDRKIEYPGQILYETELLTMQRNALEALGWVMQAVLGTSTLVSGLACTPTSPASLQVQVAPGAIMSLQNVDNTAYSSLPADTSHQIVKQGLSLDALTLSCPAPTAVGQSMVYLIEAVYEDVDSNSETLPYYNDADPASPWLGPTNSGAAQYTSRKGVCAVQAKAGVPATTGSQTAPAADTGYTGLFTVTVAYGQTSISAGNIAQVSGAPFISETLTQKISQTTGDARYMTALLFQQNAPDIPTGQGGTVDAITATYSPAVAALTNGMSLFVRAAGANASATPTFTPASGTVVAKTIVKGNGLALVAGDIAGAGHWIELQYDATLDKWVLLNPATGVSIPVSSQLQSISASVAANALTLGYAGGSLAFRNASLTNGAPTTLTVGALSLIVPSGATLGTGNGQAAELVLLVANSGGTPVLCVTNMAGGLNLDETNLISPTTISGSSNSASVIYSAAAVASNSPYRVVGVVDVTETTAGTWASAPTLVQGEGGQALAAMQSFGVGQTVQFFTLGTQRVLGTTYFNATPKTIWVHLYGAISVVSSAWLAYLNGVASFTGSQNSTAGANSSIMFPVPPGFSYSISPSNGSGSTGNWSELR